MRKIKLIWQGEDGDVHEEILEVGEVYHTLNDDGEEYTEILKAVEETA